MSVDNEKLLAKSELREKLESISRLFFVDTTSKLQWSEKDLELLMEAWDLIRKAKEIIEIKVGH